METVISYNVWAVALALTRGVRLLRTIPGRWTGFELEDTDGKASQILDEWRHGQAMVCAREFADTYRDVQRIAHA